MRIVLLAIPIFLFLNPISASGSATYKFITVSGEPTTLNASDVLDVTSFEECIGKCEKNPACIVAYQANSSAPCYLFSWNSIEEVKKNESGGVGTVAFKIYTDQPSCELNSPFLVNGKVYPLFPNDTTNFLWKIDTTETGWKITYIENRIVEQWPCGNNFSFNRPYDDGCDSECNVTMVQVWAKPGPITLVEGYNSTAESWMECIYKCYNNWDCATVHYDTASKICFRFKPAMVSFIERLTASDGHHMAIKLPMNDKLCRMTTEKLLDNQYYLLAPAMNYWQKREYFRVKTTPKYYLIKYYVDKDSFYQATTMPGCPFLNMGSGYTGKADKETFCYRHSKQPGVTQTEAKELCHLMDMELLTDKYTGAIRKPQVNEGFVILDLLNTDLTTPSYQVFGFTNMDHVNTWYGLEKIDGKWTWSVPEYRVFKDEDMPIPWAAEHPKDGATCAYVGWGKGEDDFAGYSFYTAQCNDTIADGFSCGSWQMEYQDIKQWKEVATEFGYEQDCCGFTIEELNAVRQKFE